MPLSSRDQLLLGLLALLVGLDVEVVEGHAPLEERHQQHVVERLREIDRVPGLLRVDPHDVVAEVAILAADVGERVVHVVVRVLPRLLGRCRVPVPGRRVDLRVVHPVPLAVHHVVADLHVLEDLGQRQHRGPRHPRGLEARREQHDARRDQEPPVHLDHRVDVLRVALAELAEDLVVDRVELLGELLDLLGRQALERAFDLRGHGTPQRSISTGPSGACDAGADHLAGVARHPAGAQIAHLPRAELADARVADAHAAAERQLGAGLLARDEDRRVAVALRLERRSRGSGSCRRRPRRAPPITGWKRSKWKWSASPSRSQRSHRASSISPGPQANVSRSSPSGQSSATRSGVSRPCSPVQRSCRR